MLGPEAAKNVSIQSCFITILHLANENNYTMYNNKTEDAINWSYNFNDLVIEES